MSNNNSNNNRSSNTSSNTSNDEQHREIRSLMQRSSSGRDDENTFEYEDESTSQADAPLTEMSQGQRQGQGQGGKESKPLKKEEEAKPIGEILQQAGKRAIGGGLPGAAAMFVNVGSLMWVRTIANSQYRYGGTIKDTASRLYKEGGVRRFYRGVGPALFQGPLSRFGDTAANAGMLSLLNSNEATRDIPVFIKTGAASIAAGGWRIFLMPIDTVKTNLQVNGAEGLKKLRVKMKTNGPLVMYHGALGAASATMVGHYPWFATYNTLSELIPPPEEFGKRLVRNAGIGFTSSVVSDCFSNSVRVVKTTRQTFETSISYPETVKYVVKESGISGLLFRGLQTRILANGLQGLLFSVLWKFMEEQFLKRTNF